jgi:hypothetical protein
VLNQVEGFQHFEDEHQPPDDVAHGSPLRRIDDPAVWVTGSMEREEIGILREDHSPFGVGALQVLRIRSGQGSRCGYGKNVDASLT